MKAVQKLLELGRVTVPAIVAPTKIEPTCAQTEAVWIAVHFPQITLTACHPPTDLPFVVIEPTKGQAVIYSTNALAQAQGVMAGMPLNSAYALCQNLKVLARQMQQESILLESYAAKAAHFTPNVVLSMVDTLLLEVKASLNLFGGLTGLQSQLSGALAVPHHIASAPVADAAELLARNGLNVRLLKVEQLRSTLGSLPISAMPFSDKRVAQLRHCGLINLQDLWRMPRPDLARRFGTDIAQFLDLIIGKVHRPRTYYVPPPRFEASIDLPEETDNCALLLHGAEKLFKQAEQFLQIRSAAAQTAALHFVYPSYCHQVQRSSILLVRAQQACYQAVDFLPQLREQLHNLQLDKPVINLELKIDEVVSYKPNGADLFNQHAQDQQDWQSLLGLLSSRLGRQSIYRVQSYADHRPEKACRRIPTDQPYKAKLIDVDKRTNKRPLWLLPKALPYQGAIQHLRRLSEPGRIEAGWWQGQDVQRDYYIATDQTGRKCWLYQDIRLSSSESGYAHQRMQPERSMRYVHGLYA